MRKSFVNDYESQRFYDFWCRLNRIWDKIRERRMGRISHPIVIQMVIVGCLVSKELLLMLVIPISEVICHIPVDVGVIITKNRRESQNLFLLLYLFHAIHYYQLIRFIVGSLSDHRHFFPSPQLLATGSFFRKSFS